MRTISSFLTLCSFLFSIIIPFSVLGQNCPSGNLLKKKQISKSSQIQYGSRINDDVMPEDGEDWNGPNSAILNNKSSFVVFDLAEPTTLRSILLQGDNNDTYLVSTSLDGKTFEPLWTAPKHPHAGMQTRLHQAFTREARYLKITPGEGDKAFSLGEVQVFCKPPELWPPAIETKSTKKGYELTRKHRLGIHKMIAGFFALIAFVGLLWKNEDERKKYWWVAPTSALIAFGYCAIVGCFEEGFDSWIVWLGLIGFSVAIGWWFWLFQKAGQKTKHDTERWRKFYQRGALLCIMATGALCWVNYGTFHGTRAVHYWDSFHYYTGSKYFKENRYHLIYHCTALAEADDGRKGEMDGREIRDLRDNSIKPISSALNAPEECREAFTPRRWAAFQQDVRLFRKVMGDSWWKKMFKDHGYNATPVWNMIGTQISNWNWESKIPPAGMENSPGNLKGKDAATKKKIKALFDKDVEAFKSELKRTASIDAVLYIGIFVLIFWAFGWQACALALLVLGIGYPWAYFWTGGSFGRVPWLFTAVASFCFLKKSKPLLGGFFLTWTALLRVFPGALIIGILLKVIWNLFKHKTITKNHLHGIFGCILGAAVLVPLSLPSANGIGAYDEFLQNSVKHKNTKLTNHMGMPTLLSWHPNYIARNTRDSKLDDPFKVWKEKRKETLQSRSWLMYGLLFTFAGLLFYMARRLEDWELMALSTIFIVGIFELTCYYYNFIILLAPFALRNIKYVASLIFIAGFGQAIQMMFGWYDEQYIVETVLVLGVMVYMLVDSFIEFRKLDKNNNETPNLPEDTTESSASEVSESGKPYKKEHLDKKNKKSHSKKTKKLNPANT